MPLENLTFGLSTGVLPPVILMGCVDGLTIHGRRHPPVGPTLHITNDLTIKSLDRVEEGELIILQYGGSRALALVMKLLAGQDGAVLGVLKADAELEQGPFHLKVSREGFCLSCGFDWDLELIPTSDTYPGNTEFWDSSGVVHIASERVTLSLGKNPHDVRSSRLHVDLEALSIASDPPRHASPVTRWRIWTNPSRRLELRSEPLFTFEVAQDRKARL
jgi:hypothetical protein